jgi:hypothetical protein
MTTLRQLAEAAQPYPWEPADYSPPWSCKDAFRTAANPAAILALLDTIDAQRRLLERVILVRQGYQQSLHRDIAAHLEATK